MYKLIKRENHARRGELQTVHGTVQTPAFMNVGDGWRRLRVRFLLMTLKILNVR